MTRSTWCVTVFLFAISALAGPAAAQTTGSTVAGDGEFVVVARSEKGSVRESSALGRLSRVSMNMVSLRMNDDGDCVGFLPWGDSDIAVLWNWKGRQPLLPYAGVFSRAADVNAAGQIVGQTSTGCVDRGGREIRRAFLWDKDVMTLLDSQDPFRQSCATAVSEIGEIVGWVETESGERHAALWPQDNPMGSASQVIDLGTLGGDNSEATAINRSGLIVGFAETETIVPGARHSVAFRYDYPSEFGIEALPGLNPGGDSAALDANDAGQIVGWCKDTGGRTRAVCWTGDQVRDLGGLGGGEGVAYAINSAGIIVGMATTPLPKVSSERCAAPVERAFAVVGGRLIDLNSLLTPNSGWLLLEARDINDRNEITGIAWFGGEFGSFVINLHSSLVPGASMDGGVGDLNCDGGVGIQDLTTLLSEFGSACP